jgi:hypothetical protein
MSAYTIHQPLREDDASPDPERFRFVRDGFYFWAFVFGPLWILRHRLWLVLLIYIVVMAGVSAALWTSGLRTAAPLVHFLLALLLGIEAGTLRRWTLAGRGWKTLGVVVADDLESAERRFFDAWVKDGGDDRSVAAATPPPPPARRIPTQPGQDVIGLFPEPGAPR